VQTDTTLSFHSAYPYDGGYWFDFSGTTSDGVVWTGTGTDSGGTWPATLTLTGSSATTYNHGEYVAASIDEYGSPDAHSCIGMPIVSNKNK